jgi:hemoglobin
MPGPQSTVYERVGGDAFFDELTRRFYASVAVDPVLRPLYPDDDDGFEAARRHLRDFLIQRFGGPWVYRETRGEPSLRRRHAPFAIGVAERDAWVAHMTAALRESPVGALDRTQMLSFFEATATHLVNRHGPART